MRRQSVLRGVDAMKAAFYEKDITPPLGDFLVGSYCRWFAEDVLDPLFVRAAVIESNGRRVAIIGIDACEFPDDLHDAVAKRIMEYTGISPENILISVTHTHKGIPIESSPEIDAYADEPYKNVVYRLIADCAILASRRLSDVAVRFGSGYADDIAFNRNYILRNGTYRTNKFTDIVDTLSGIDPDVPFLFFRDKDGTPKGAIVSYACHQDVNPGTAYSGAFAYVLAQELKKQYGNDFVTVFLPGACGDINHIDPNIVEMPKDWYIHMGKRLGEEVIQAEKTAGPVEGDTLAVCKELVELPLRAHTNESVLKEKEKFVKARQLTSIRNIAFFHATSNEKTVKHYLQVIRIGDVYLYAYPGEIYVDFGLAIKKRSPSAKNIIATLANGGCGYVATRKAFDKQSMLYETMLCRLACLDPEAGYIMNDKLIAFSNRLKRES